MWWAITYNMQISQLSKPMHKRTGDGKLSVSKTTLHMEQSNYILPTPCLTRQSCDTTPPLIYAIPKISAVNFIHSSMLKLPMVGRACQLVRKQPQ